MEKSDVKPIYFGYIALSKSASPVIRKSIPHLFTLGNLFLGVLSLQLVAEGKWHLGAWCLFAAAFLDFFDGLVARLLGVAGDFGKQLDSLADVVSFGVAPGWLMFHYLNAAVEYQSNVLNLTSDMSGLAYMAFAIPLFSALRLARFNISKNESVHFSGLATPAMGLVIASFALILQYEPLSFLRPMILSPLVLLFWMVFSCGLMVSAIPMWSLKLSGKLPLPIILLIVGTIVLGLIFKFSAIPIILLLYLAISIVFKPRSTT